MAGLRRRSWSRIWCFSRNVGRRRGARADFVDAYRAETGETRLAISGSCPPPGRAGLRDLDRPGDRARMRDRLAHRKLTIPGLDLIYWADGEPLSRITTAMSAKVTNLYSSSVVALDPKTGKLRWYFPVHSARPCMTGMPPKPPMLVDRRVPRQSAQVAAAGKSQWLLLCARPGDGQVFSWASRLFHKLTWASGIGADGRPQVLPGLGADGRGDQEPVRTSRAPRIGCPQPTTRRPDCSMRWPGNRAPIFFTKSAAWWEPGKSFLLWRRSAPACRARPPSGFSAGDRHTDGKDRMGGAAHRKQSAGRGLGAGSSLHRRGPGVFFFFCDDSGAFCRGGCAQRKAALEFPYQSGMARFTHDVYGGGQAVH